MRKLFGKCLICGGDPTVKAHLFPRALSFDIRGDSPNLVEGSLRRDGIKLNQNGEWDRELLCREHEKQSGKGEKYAVELIRSLPKEWRANEHGAYELLNPKPALLAHFVFSTVWKFVMSKYGRDHQLDLGPYEPILRERVFGDAGTDLPFIVGRHRLHLRGSLVPLGIPPHRQKLDKWRTWMFAIGGLQFHLKTDQRPFPSDWNRFLGNDNDVLHLTEGPDNDIRYVPILQPIFTRMRKRPL